MRADHHFHVMGTEGNIVVHGNARERAVAHVLDRLSELERRWSRFRPDSDISRINAAHGRPVRVAAETATLLRRAIEGWRASDGLFDPTVGAAMLAHGYDRDFASLGGPGQPAPAEAGRGCDGIDLDLGDGWVRVPAGISLDPGGIGKGLAADIVADEVLERGSTGVLINIGGDMRMAGHPPAGGWVVAVDDPRRPGSEWLRLGLAQGAVATSSTLRRRWQQGGLTCHHVMDPRTGRPAAESTVAVTVIAHAAWWAEVAATALLLAEEPDQAPLASTVEYVALRADGGVRTSEGMAEVVGS
jgi:thiamine biosynthesis lipoprotein